MSASSRTRTAVTLPSASAASSMFWIWPRPWIVAWASSLRSSFQRTGTACLRASATHSSLLGVDVELRAEAAPDGGRDHPHLLLGNAQRQRGHDLEDVRDLRGRVQDHVAAVRLRYRGDGAWFHRHRDEALLNVLLADRVRRCRERLVDLTLVTFDLEIPRVALVGAQFVVDHDSVAERVVEIDHRCRAARR